MTGGDFSEAPRKCVILEPLIPGRWEGCQGEVGLSAPFFAQILASFFLSPYFQHNNVDFDQLQHIAFFPMRNPYISKY